MHIIVALGNPGPQYEFTRHNFGWLVADAITDSIKISGRDNTPSYLAVRGSHRGAELVLCRPQTYMNLSGIAVDNLLRKYNASPADMLVIYDEIDLPFGTVKLKIGGGDGGHKGIRSIINETGTADFLRLRLGIRGADKPEDTAEFVLTPFSQAETSALDKIIKSAKQAALDLLHSDARLVMNAVNRRPPVQKPVDENRE